MEVVGSRKCGEIQDDGALTSGCQTSSCGGGRGGEVEILRKAPEVGGGERR